MKKIFVIFLIFISVFLCGFNKRKPLILLSPRTIVQGNEQYLTKYFERNQRIYYMIYFPKGMKKGIYRVQIFKKDDKSEFWGYKQMHHYDYKIDEKGKKYITDYFVMLEKGHFVVQVFNLKNVNKPVALGDFWVK